MINGQVSWDGSDQLKIDTESLQERLKNKRHQLQKDVGSCLVNHIDDWTKFAVKPFSFNF